MLETPLAQSHQKQGNIIVITMLVKYDYHKVCSWSACAHLIGPKICKNHNHSNENFNCWNFFLVFFSKVPLFIYIERRTYPDRLIKVFHSSYSYVDSSFMK